MQKTGLANFSSFLVWSGLEKGITYGCDHFEAVNNHSPVWQPHDQTTNRMILV